MDVMAFATLIAAQLLAVIYAQQWHAANFNGTEDARGPGTEDGDRSHD